MSLLSANVKDFVSKKDRKVDEGAGGAGGAAGNAGAFILADAIESELENLKNMEKKSDDNSTVPVQKGFFQFIQQ
jgi:tRNA G37 N-methylase TrmD